MRILLESWKKNKKGIFLMMLSSVCACLGQLLWKKATAGEHFIFYLFLGIAVYGIGAVLMLVAYRFGKLSVLQPILSFNYVLSLVLGAVVLHENISYLNIAGVCIILLGVLLISGGDTDD
jgi:undecaprenyl phosphate-alpha-L-ara4N flippase subunit ArnE